MEIKNINEAIEAVLKGSDVREYFNAEQIKSMADEMVKVMVEVLGDKKINEIVFEEGEMMFFRFDDNSVHLGLGLIKMMVDVWFMIETGGFVFSPPVREERMRQLVLSSLKGDAAHEAGHRVIDRNPVEDLGIPQEEWGQLGISSLANALMDCRNDQRIMQVHPELKPDMIRALEFSFGPQSRLDWVSGRGENLLHRGYIPLYPQFEFEAMRTWAYGDIHPLTDRRVRMVLGKYGEDIRTITTDKSCLPGKAPSELEVKAKARKVYKKIAEINKGDYQQILVARDKDNEAVHSAITIVGLANIAYDIPQKLLDLIVKEVEAMDMDLREELNEKLDQQKREKTFYEAKNAPFKKIKKETAEAVKTQQTVVADPDQAVTTQAMKPADTATVLEILGPAIRVDELSDGLRDFLKDLFQKMQEVMKDEMLEQMMQQLLENPEKFLKELEDLINQQLRPHTIPSTVPTHQEMEAKPAKSGSQPPPAAQPIKAGGTSYLSKDEIVHAAPRELEETERWLDENVDLRERVEAWREAIYSSIRKGNKKTSKPQSKLHGPELVRDEIRKKMGDRAVGKIFVDTHNETQEKITISIMWRTQAINLKEALKLIVFLVKVFGDDQIRKYLNLEILVSQNIPGVTQSDDAVPIPVVLSFGQDPVVDYDAIMQNLLALQSLSSGNGQFSIVQDATALKTQRERLLTMTPGVRKKFLIDFWDEAAIEFGEDDPMGAVVTEIKKTQEVLKGKAFCFAMTGMHTGPESPASAYGPDHFLAENSTERLIKYLDIVIRSMIQYEDKYSAHIKDRVERELGIELP